MNLTGLNSRNCIPISSMHFGGADKHVARLIAIEFGCEGKIRSRKGTKVPQASSPLGNFLHSGYYPNFLPTRFLWKRLVEPAVPQSKKSKSKNPTMTFQRCMLRIFHDMVEKDDGKSFMVLPHHETKSIVPTDHSALKYLFGKKRMPRRELLSDGLSLLQEFDFNKLLILKERESSSRIICPDWKPLIMRCVHGNEALEILSGLLTIASPVEHHGANLTAKKIFDSGSSWPPTIIKRCPRVCQDLSGSHLKDRNQSQNDKTEHGMEKTVSESRPKSKIPKSESIRKIIRVKRMSNNILKLRG
ncbi:hypothetical protein Tco_0505796 [Tanacetum coccineum]